MKSSGLAFEPIDPQDPSQTEWTRLAAIGQNIFATSEWISIWWRHFGGERNSAAVACKSSGDLVAILPLYFWSRRPPRVLRFMGHGTGDQLGPVCAPKDRPIAARALRAYLAELEDSWDVLLGEQLPGEEPWANLLAGRSLRREGSPLVRNEGGGWDAFLSARSANFRQQARRRERNLGRRYALHYRLVTDHTRLDRDLDKLFELHGARWRAGGSAFGGQREEFHREFASCALERGWLRLWFLELDGSPVAAWYGFRFGGVESYYQAGRDPSKEHESVGFVLLAHSIRAAFEDGVSEYRFLRGDDSYKYRFADDDPGLETVAVSRGLVGKTAVAAAAALGRAPALRRALRARLGA